VLSEELGKRTGHEKLYHLSRTMENTVMAEKHINPNVDFYSASTYYSLNIPVDLFTPIFAVSRMSGWTAHVLEQYHNNRLIRPRRRIQGQAGWAGYGFRFPNAKRAGIEMDERAILHGAESRQAGAIELSLLPHRGHVSMNWMCARRKIACRPAAMSATRQIR